MKEDVQIWRVQEIFEDLAPDENFSKIWIRKIDIQHSHLRTTRELLYLEDSDLGEIVSMQIHSEDLNVDSNSRRRFKCRQKRRFKCRFKFTHSESLRDKIQKKNCGEELNFLFNGVFDILSRILIFRGHMQLKCGREPAAQNFTSELGIVLPACDTKEKFGAQVSDSHFTCQTHSGKKLLDKSSNCQSVSSYSASAAFTIMITLRATRVSS